MDDASMNLGIPATLLALLVAACAVAIGQWRRRRALEERATQLEAQIGEQQSRIDGLLRDAARLPDMERRVAEAESSLRGLRDELTATTAREAGALAQLDAAREAQAKAERNAEETRGRMDAAQLEARTLSSSLAAAAAERDAAISSREQAKAFLEDAQAKLSSAFIEVASKVFDEKAVALDRKIGDSAVASKVGLESALTPFATKLNEFQAELRKLGTDQTATVHTLRGSIEQLQQLNQRMATSTDDLARALKGNAKTRGDWGEMILDTVLKASGLEEGRNYVKQNSARDEDSGSLLRPDVLVHLPDDRQVVVDAKVNLVAWAEACNADTPAAHQEALARHTTALRGHMRDLAEKNYPKAMGGKSLDLTVMFVPIEGALAAALEFNPGLQAEAFERKVVFVSPNTLMAMLRVVERLWTRDKLQRQVGIIGDEAGKLLDALSSFIADFDEIEAKLDAGQKAFKTARNRLSESPQSVVARARRLVEAGAKGKRPLHEDLLPVAGADPGALPLLDSPPDAS
jgi:DNA recombination protein RmuC